MLPEPTDPPSRAEALDQPNEAAAVGYAAPDFELPCTNMHAGARGQVSLHDYRGQWLLLLFYPRDFSFVCPTELMGFSAARSDFRKRKCSILAVGVDSIELHEEWIRTPAEDGGLGALRYPLASDEDGAVSRAYGVYMRAERVAGRGLFLIDPEGVLQYKAVHNLRVGRSSEEALRVLDALRAGGLCPSSWTLGDGTIDPAQVLTEGRILGHYRILQKLGEGGFGQVLQAWDLWLERTVALKVLRPGRKLDRERVLAEARPAAKLQHPNICLVYAVEVQEGLPVIAMEYLPGESLSRRLRSGPIDPKEARSIGRQVASGLAASHAAGIVHGDLKPGNIMIGSTGHVKVLDFGLAQVGPTLPADDEEGSPPTPVRPVFRGTPAYMSPEHARARPVEAASDVFSFGLVLYEMLTAKRVLPVKSLRAGIRAMRSQDLSRTALELPPPFKGLVALCLSPRPEDRPTMTALAYWLADA